MHANVGAGGSFTSALHSISRPTTRWWPPKHATWRERTPSRTEFTGWPWSRAYVTSPRFPEAARRDEKGGRRRRAPRNDARISPQRRTGTTTAYWRVRGAALDAIDGARRATTAALTRARAKDGRWDANRKRHGTLTTGGGGGRDARLLTTTCVVLDAERVRFGEPTLKKCWIKGRRERERRAWAAARVLGAVGVNRVFGAAQSSAVRAWFLRCWFVH